jgi:hypothetical protein
MAKIVIITTENRQELSDVLDRMISEGCPIAKMQDFSGIEMHIVDGGPIPTDLKELLSRLHRNPGPKEKTDPNPSADKGGKKP